MWPSRENPVCPDPVWRPVNVCGHPVLSNWMRVRWFIELVMLLTLEACRTNEDAFSRTLNTHLSVAEHCRTPQ